MVRRRSNAVAQQQESLLGILIPIFEKVQRDDDDFLSAEKEVLAVLEEHKLTSAVRDLSLDSEESNTGGGDPEELTEALSHIIDCTVYKGLNDCSRRVLRLIAVIVAQQGILVDRIVAFSECGTEAVRAASTFLISEIFMRAVQSETLVDGSLDILDCLQQALVARCTDKTVSVRAAAISSNDDPEIRPLVLWILQHDSSAANRRAAARCLEGSLAASDYLVQRIRDTKIGVRTAAIQSLTLGGNNCGILGDIVETGWTERCPETKKSTENLIRHVFKEFHFDLEKLLKEMNVVEFPEAAANVVTVLHATTPDDIQEDFSAAEVQAFNKGLTGCLDFQIDGTSINLEKLFIARALVGLLPHNEQDAHISQIFPDVSHACQVLEQISQSLVREIAENESENEERISLLFTQVVELITHNGIDEEGSRRLFVTCMKSFVVNVVTPDVFVPCCLKALGMCDAGISATQETLEKLSDQLDSEDIGELATLRYLQIASTVLDTEFVDMDPRPFLHHTNSSVRLAAVDCLGKIGLHNTPSNVDLQHVLDIARDDTNTEEVRSQAALVLSDWSFVTGKVEEPYRELIWRWMKGRRALISTVACEIAMKQLLGKSVCDSDWISTLVEKFFGSVDDEDEDAVRLQQLLALFFPAMVQTNRDSVVGCIERLLEKNKKTSVLKMVQYVTQTASVVIEVGKSSAELMAAVQIVTFLSENASDLSKTLVRSLCKMVDGWEWDIDSELYEHLSVLKELLDELLNNEVIGDSSALAHLRTSFARLDGVEMEDQLEEEEGSDQEELTEAMEHLNIENPVPVGKNETPSSRGERRNSRRLRPSN